MHMFPKLTVAGWINVYGPDKYRKGTHLGSYLWPTREEALARAAAIGQTPTECVCLYIHDDIS